MRGLILSLTTCTALILSGCSLVPNWLKGGTSIEEERSQSAELRTTPEVDYQFGETEYQVEIHENLPNSTSVSSYSPAYNTLPDYSNYDVILYDVSPVQPVNSTPIDPRDAAFVKLNGKSQDIDWRNCEVMSRGYLFASEYDFRLDPNFEVCMRNKGYVLTAEVRSYEGSSVSARTSGLRGYSQPDFHSATGYQTSYSYP